MAARTWLLRACALSASLVACGEDAPAPEAWDSPAPDAGAPDAGPPEDAGRPPLAEIRIGTGETRFEPFGADPVFPLVVGPQGGGRYGGIHVPVALELVDVTPAELSLVEVVLVGEDGTEHSAPLQRDPALTPFVAGRELVNLQPRLLDCCAVEGGPLLVQAIATRTEGGALTASVRGRVDACPPDLDEQPICPP